MHGLLFNFARTKLGKLFIGWIFANMDFIIPLDRLVETKNWIAFRHPQPAYSIHILLVPKKALPNFSAISPVDTELLTDLISTVQKIVSDLNLGESGYRLITNGGAYQDIPQLHFHLVSGDTIN